MTTKLSNPAINVLKYAISSALIDIEDWQRKIDEYEARIAEQAPRLKQLNDALQLLEAAEAKV